MYPYNRLLDDGGQIRGYKYVANTISTHHVFVLTLILQYDIVF